MARVIGFDIGQTRVGVAVSDDSQSLATPLRTLSRKDIAADSRILKNLFDEYEPEFIVVGLPLTLSGDEGPQASLIRKDAVCLFSSFCIDVKFYDERNSSKEAQAALREMDVDARRQKGKLDMIAATLFLQAFLDSAKARA